MTDTKENLKKRGKKGGTQFPRFSLSHLNSFLKSLVGKTHISTINIEQLNAGVFKIGAKSDTGKVKSSALKQFGLLEGDYKKLKASKLASQIEMANGEEKTSYLQTAFFNVSVFKNAFDTFQNSTIDKNKIAQYAVSTLKIHPDMKDEFVKVLIGSAEIAGLCSSNGNAVTFGQSAKATESNSNPENTESADTTNITSEEDENEVEDENNKNNNVPPLTNNKQTGKLSNINVNIDVDPSMDPEKLEKLLKLLKSYGAI